MFISTRKLRAVGVTLLSALGGWLSLQFILEPLAHRPVPVWTSALKAATYHGLELERAGETWRARVLFDV